MRGQRKSVGLPIQLNNAVNMVWYIKKLAFASGDLQPTIYSQNHWCGSDVHVEWKFLAKHFCYCALNCVFKTRFQDLKSQCLGVLDLFSELRLIFLKMRKTNNLVTYQNCQSGKKVQKINISKLSRKRANWNSKIEYYTRYQNAYIFLTFLKA